MRGLSFPLVAPARVAMLWMHHYHRKCELTCQGAAIVALALSFPSALADGDGLADEEDVLLAEVTLGLLRLAEPEPLHRQTRSKGRRRA